MRGRVRHGNRLGRTLGFPTANSPVKRRRVALTGVFAVRVHGAWACRAWPAVANLGTRPMVDGRQMLLEAHLFDFDGDLYGRELEVEFVARLRDELTFAFDGCDGAADAARCGARRAANWRMVRTAEVNEWWTTRTR